MEISQWKSEKSVSHMLLSTAVFARTILLEIDLKNSYTKRRIQDKI